MERLNDHKHTSPPPSKGAKPEEPQRIENPGKGHRTPALWGQWLTGGLRGLQRQMLDALNIRQDRATHSRGAFGGGEMYHGTADRKAVARRRARNKVARRQRRVNRMRSKR